LAGLAECLTSGEGCAQEDCFGEKMRELSIFEHFEKEDQKDLSFYNSHFF